jgi:arylsulfatase
MFGNKGLWADGWSIVTSHRLEPWDMATARPITAPWELYDLKADPGQRDNLAARQPGRVAAMNALFEEQAARYHVNPIGNISEGMLASMATAREEFARRGGKWRYPGPVRNIQQTVGPPIMALGFRLTADLDLPRAGITGPIFAAGGTLGGIALYLRGGKPVFALNTIHGKTSEIAASEALEPGSARVVLQFDRPKGPGPAPVTIIAEGKVVAEGTIAEDAMKNFFIFELFGVGHDGGTPVLAGARPDMTFPGTISDVTFDFTVPNTAAPAEAGAE